LVTFFAQAKKVTRSPAGEWKHCTLGKQERINVDSRFRGNDVKREALDYTRLLSRALRAIRCANVRSGILPPQSGVRRNDGIYADLER